MENKINIAELLKDCPNGMELDCTILDSGAKVFLKEVLSDDFAYPIAVTVKYNDIEYPKSFTKYGAFNDLPYCKCVIFPKGKTTWEGFAPSCEFKDGDIVVTTLGNIAIIGKYVGEELFCVYGLIIDNNFYNNEAIKVCVKRFATEEEKQKLFDVIKEKGYKWNDGIKTLEELIEPNFKVGDTIQDVDGYKVEITKVDIDEECYEYMSIIAKGIGSIPFEYQDNWKLVPAKFDVTTLKPFDNCKYSLDKGKTWKFAQYWYIQDNYIVTDIEIELWQD